MISPPYPGAALANASRRTVSLLRIGAPMIKICHSPDASDRAASEKPCAHC
jgi:hypothetical protein